MTMGNPNVKHWIIKAAPVLQRVSKAKTRFSAAIGVNQVTILAAADELEAATMEAMVWMMENHCSDVRLDSHVSLMLNSCAEVAQTAKRAITHPSGDLEAVLGRLGGLLGMVDFGSQSLDVW